MNLQHFIFTPKYRRPCLSGQVAATVESKMRYIAAQQGMTIHAIAIQPDHVHVFVDIGRHLSVSKAAYFLKWFSSCHTRRLHPELQNVSKTALWGVHYFSRSVGGDRRTVKQYIDNQMQNVLKHTQEE